MKKHFYETACTLLLLLGSTGAESNDVYITPNANVLRLQNYLPNYPAIYYSGSTCPQGQIVLPASATDADKNRLWATVLAAKLSNRIVFFYYDNETTPGSCFIKYFGVDN